MADAVSSAPRRRTWPQALPFYYGWVNVVMASLAMTATLPGRTHGLGLVTEPLLRDLPVDRVLFARINLAATLVGALFCFPVGWLIDRCGVRTALVLVTAALGVSVVAMSDAAGAAALLAGLVLVRGFGQSALSVASIAAIGKWFRRSLGIAMGGFAVLLTFGFIGSVLAMGAEIGRAGWRGAWRELGLAVLSLTPVFWLFVRSTPEACGLAPDPPADDAPAIAGAADFNVRQALRTPAFWIVLLGSGAFNLVWSGVTLFNESLLVERGVDQGASVQIMAILTGAGLVANLVCGGLASPARIVKLLGAGMATLAAGLVALTIVDGLAGARLYAGLVGVSGGIVTVVFFAAWGHLFGRAELGRIQGLAQFGTVLASAVGPELMAECRQWTGSYSAVLHALAAIAGVLALAAWFVPLPRAAEQIVGSGSPVG